MEPYNELACACGWVAHWVSAQGDVKIVDDEQRVALSRPFASPLRCTCKTYFAHHLLRYEVDAADVVTLTIEKCPKQATR